MRRFTTVIECTMSLSDEQLLGLGDLDDAERVRVAAALLREAPGRLGPSHESLYEALCDIGDAVTTMCDIIEAHDVLVIDHG